MTRWERMEQWLFDYECEKFTAAELAFSLGVSNKEASRMISAYLDAQRRPESGTLYVLKRQGRTSQARWSVGEKTADARIIGGTLFEDIKAKIKRAYEPDLKRLAARNPRAARFVEAKLVALMDGAMVVLAHSLDASDENSE